MKVLGIDLGTSSSAAAVLVDGKLHLIPSSEKRVATAKPFPSVVSFFKDGGCLIGSAALEQSAYNPEGTIRNIKREMGSRKKVSVFGAEYMPQLISALFLMKIRIDAARFLGEEVTKAVITVPANFNDVQRRATKDAGRIAGLDVIRLMTEPVAAAIAYGAHKITEPERILVFDMGAGTLDVSVIEADGRNFFEVIATSGPTNLGGVDMDEEIKGWLLSGFEDGTPDRQSLAQIGELAEMLKVALSEREEVPYSEIATLGNAQVELAGEITRHTMEGLIGHIIAKSEAVIGQVLKDAGMAPSDIDRVIPVGGPTRMPAIRRMLTRAVREPEGGVDPDFAVSSGAAIEGAIMADNQHLPVPYQGLTLLNVTPLDLGEEAQEKGRHKLVLMIPKNTPYPTEHTAVFFVNSIMQTKVKISIWQGDFEQYPEFAGNVNIGTFTLRGLRPEMQNEVEVTYGIDEDGILTVNAKEIGTGTTGKIVIDRMWEGLGSPPQLEHTGKKTVLFERQYRNTLDSGGANTDHAAQSDAVDLDWMCECLVEAKKIIVEYHSRLDPAFFDTARFELFLQLDAQYAYAHIGLGNGPVYPIGVHYALRADTHENRRILVVTFVHELLHAVHPDWGHNKIRPEERRLANLAGYFDAYRESEIKFLSGQMSICNNSMSDSEQRIKVRCDG